MSDAGKWGWGVVRNYRYLSRLTALSCSSPLNRPAREECRRFITRSVMTTNDSRHIRKYALRLRPDGAQMSRLTQGDRRLELPANLPDRSWICPSRSAFLALPLFNRRLTVAVSVV